MRHEICFDLKYDGNSVIGEYDKGKPYSFLTRGKDGLGMDLLDVFKSNKIDIKALVMIQSSSF